jgi:arsenate reductase (thioredoxin)
MERYRSSNAKVKILFLFDDPPRLAANAQTEEERPAPYRRVRDEIRAFVESLPKSILCS